jgi:hypothetical protein
MPNRFRWTSAALSMVLALLVPLTAAAQPDASANEESPEIEGLGWYTSVDVVGADIESAYSAEEVEQWAAMLDAAGASFEDLEYTYQQVVDPATLPQLGGLATVTIDGASEEAVLAAVLVDISSQAVSLGAEPTVSAPAIVGGKDVTKVDLPDELGPDDAYVYVRGDTAWVFVMQEALAELGLQGMA